MTDSSFLGCFAPINPHAQGLQVTATVIGPVGDGSTACEPERRLAPSSAWRRVNICWTCAWPALLVTTALMHDVSTCRGRHPARWTAVLPGPAIVFPAMNLDNPFSIDWVHPLEMHGSADRLVNEARQLNQRGNDLVLVAAHPGTASPVLDEMVHQLTGPRDDCGGFIAIHST